MNLSKNNLSLRSVINYKFTLFLSLIALTLMNLSMFASIDAIKKAYSAKDYTKAYTLIQSDLKEQTKNPELLLLAGDIYLEMGKSDSSLLLYKAAEKLQPGNYGVPRKIGQYYVKVKDYKNAISVLTGVIKQNPKDPWNHLALADALFASGKLSEAEKSYLEAKKLNVRLWQASIGLALIYSKNGNNEQVILQYEDALKVDPGMLDIRKKHVLLLKDNKDPDPSPDETISVNKPPFVDNTALMNNVVYPELAKKAGLEGKVILRVLVRRNGKVKRFIVEQTDSEIFNKSAGDAVMKTQFLPALQNGKPIACWLTVPISFKIR